MRFFHSKCLSTKTEEDAQKSFDASTSPWFDEASVNRHDECRSPEFFGDVYGDVSRTLTLDLRFLRTCRQIYDEAKSFCYTANTFSFDHWSIFEDFVKTVSWTSYMRSVRLRVRCGTNGDGLSNCRMLQNVLKKLTGLRMVTFDLEQFSISGSRKYDQQTEEASHLTKQLFCFAVAALKSVEVVVSDTHFCNFNSPETSQCSQDDIRSQQLNRWTMTQKQEYSQFLRHALIQHRGEDNDIKGKTGDSRELKFWWDGSVF